MKRITALLLILALLLPCAATATTNRVSLVVGDMTLSLTLPGDWTQASTVADEEMISHLIVQENIVFYAQGAGNIPPVLVICAAPVEPDAKVGDRAWNAVDFSDGFIQRSYYVGAHAGYDKTTVSMDVGYRIVYSVIVNGFEYTFEFFWPVFTTESAMQPEEIIESLRFRPLSAFPAHTPLNLRHHKSGQSSITLKWETEVDAAYHVEYRTAGGTWITQSDAIPGSGRTRTYTVQGLQAGTDYTIRVTPLTNGRSASAEEVSAATKAPSHGPMNLTHADSTDTSIALQWASQPGATYRVEYRTANTEWTTLQRSISAPGKSITQRFTGLTPACTYTFRVTAMVNGADAVTEEITAATKAPARVSASATDTRTVALPAVGITLDVPAPWLYGTPEMGLTSPLAIASSMTPDEFDLIFTQQGLHFYAVSLTDGLVCYVIPVKNLPELKEENKDALLTELHKMTGIPAEPTARVFLPRATGSFAFLQYEQDGNVIGMLFGQGSGGGFALTLQPLASQTFPMATMNALLNSIRVIE